MVRTARVRAIDERTGTDGEVAAPAGTDLAEALHEAHASAYGYGMLDEPVEVVTVRVVAEADALLAGPPASWDLGEAGPARARRVGVRSGWAELPVVDRAGLAPGDELRGPTLVEQPDSTTLLDEGDVATVDDAGNPVVRRPA